MPLRTYNHNPINETPRRWPHRAASAAPVRVMIVEDSHVVRDFLQYIIGRDARLQVVAAVTSAEEALRVIGKAAPDVISMDIRLPGMNGFEATRRIMAERPTPIVVVASSAGAEDLKISMNALKAGALAVLEKPTAATNLEYEAMAEQLCTRLVIMSRVNVVRQRFQRKPVSPLPATSERRKVVMPRRRNADSIQMLGIVASTGGPNALERLLNTLPVDLPVPIALVQHITASFQDAFVAWLRDVCPLPVVEATAGLKPQAGAVYVAPANRHLYVGRDCFRLGDGAPERIHCPSGTVLLDSIAKSFGGRSMGVLLTGMGDDGAEGLRSIHDVGGYAIAEDESTAVVYGMPAVAVRLGAVSESLPLHAIGPRILELVAN